MKVNPRSVGAIALGIVAIAGCSSSKGSASNTPTTTIPRAATSTTRRRENAATTTTTAIAATTSRPASPPATSTSAVSASFVSPEQGYALLADGHVDATSDGGRTWRRVGRVPSPQGTIRFIDAADGFAFTAKRGPLWITHDAGATWTSTPTPFTNVYDLAIADGTIDVVALQEGAKPVFRIWTSPTAHLVWKASPTTLAVGAGPVPSQQIVLNSGKGWILGTNRTVIAGARLNAANQWTAWTPPCVHRFGPAYLAASSASDVVVACDEGVWGGTFKGITPTVWLSFNGGSTFVRKVAPTFGPVLSPMPAVAVLVGRHLLQRTFDGGASWKTVGRLPGLDTTDWGFTTPRQGFVINGGQTLMTRDAGGTWRPVTLP